jgi:hypothetical protein
MIEVRGVYKTHRATGRPCVVCRGAVDFTDVQREIAETREVVLIAHEAC